MQKKIQKDAQGNPVLNDDGSPRYEYVTELPNPVPIMTGRHVSGPIILGDGTVYDLSEDYIEVPSVDHPHHDAIHHHIEKKLATLAAGGHEAASTIVREATALHGQFPVHQDTTTPPAAPVAPTPAPASAPPAAPTA